MLSFLSLLCGWGSAAEGGGPWAFPPVGREGSPQGPGNTKFTLCVVESERVLC